MFFLQRSYLFSPSLAVYMGRIDNYLTTSISNLEYNDYLCTDYCGK